MMTAGGLALFLFGMELMVDALQQLAGFQLRSLLGKLTRRQVYGVAGGTISGALVHSGPTTVMIVGFVNAGILAFSHSLGLIFGANIGTTLSMQIIAFDIGHYCFLALGIAIFARIVTRSRVWRNVSLVILGFGLLFLGMEVMKQAMGPLKNSQILMDGLAMIDATTMEGLLLGTLVATLLTALLQSSGATIGLVFSLASLGIITNLEQTIPFILGAHIGTCTPTLISAIGTSANAKRAAIAHLMFNVVGSILAIAMTGFYMWAVPKLSGNLVRQVANLNTGIQLINTLLLLPLCPLFAKMIEKMVPTKGNENDVSHLDPSLIPTPEMAILAVIKELRRAANITSGMLQRSLDGLVALDPALFQRVEKEEQAVDLIKSQVDNYVAQIGERRLSPRQVMLLQRLIIVSNSVERLGDHIETIGTLSRIKIHKNIWFDDESMLELLDLANLVVDMLNTTMESIDPTLPDYREKAQRVLKLRKAYKKQSKIVKEELESQIEQMEEGAVAAMFFLRYIVVFDRIVHHLRAIARQELKETYFVREWKLNKTEPLAPPERVPPTDHRSHPSYLVALTEMVKKQVLPENSKGDDPDPEERIPAPDSAENSSDKSSGENRQLSGTGGQ